MYHRTKQSKGRQYEKKVQSQIASGSLWFSPLDLSTDKHLIECKMTDKKGYRVTRELLEKIWNQALSLNKEPFLCIGIKRNDKEYFSLQCCINIEKREGISND